MRAAISAPRPTSRLGRKLAGPPQQANNLAPAQSGAATKAQGQARLSAYPSFGKGRQPFPQRSAGELAQQRDKPVEFRHRIHLRDSHQNMVIQARIPLAHR